MVKNTDQTWIKNPNIKDTQIILFHYIKLGPYDWDYYLILYIPWHNFFFLCSRVSLPFFFCKMLLLYQLNVINTYFQYKYNIKYIRSSAMKPIGLINHSLFQDKELPFCLFIASWALFVYILQVDQSYSCSWAILRCWFLFFL